MGLLATGCVHRPVGEVRPPVDATLYDVGVAAANDDRMLTALYALQVERTGPGVWTFRTLSTEGTWTEGDDTVEFRSDTPRPDDPWTLTLQHALASVPAAVRLDATGRPATMVDPAGWSALGRSAMGAVGLPERAVAANQGLIDPDGLVASLARDFPGTPAEGAWRNELQVAGLDVTSVEQCTVSRAAGHSTWDCSGTLEQRDTSGRFHLIEGTRSTRITVDARGLLELDERWEGTIVLAGEQGDVLAATPVAGRRSVRRRTHPANTSATPAG